MKKYVYDFTKFLTRSELINELRNINYINPKKEEILDSYNVNMDNIDIDDIETTIKLNNFKKDIKSILSMFDFSILYADSSSQDYMNNKRRLFDLLEWNGINTDINFLDELAKVVKIIENNEEILNILNKNIVDETLLKKVLKDVKISNVTIKNVLILINSLAYQQAIYLPIVRSKYYDELDNIFYTINVNIPENNPTNLRSFSGEIFESLKFNNDEEARIYQLEHNIDEQLDSEVTTYMHFKGSEINDNWAKEMHITKSKNAIVIMYGEPFILQNEKRNCSITENEINSIIMELKNKTPNNEFLKYVLKELKSLKKVLGQKQYIRKDESIDVKSLRKISAIISDENYGEDRNIYFKSKIISSYPLEFNKEKTLKKI